MSLDTEFVWDRVSNPTREQIDYYVCRSQPFILVDTGKHCTYATHVSMHTRTFAPYEEALILVHHCTHADITHTHTSPHMPFL